MKIYYHKIIYLNEKIEIKKKLTLLRTWVVEGVARSRAHSTDFELTAEADCGVGMGRNGLLVVTLSKGVDDSEVLRRDFILGVFIALGAELIIAVELAGVFRTLCTSLSFLSLFLIWS